MTPEREHSRLQAVHNHPTFQCRCVTCVEVDYVLLEQLPVNDLVHERLRSVENEQIDDAFLNTDP